MQRKGTVLLALILALLLMVSACGPAGEPSVPGSSQPPASSPQEEEPPAPPEKDPGPGAELLEVREFLVSSAYDCAEVSQGKAIFFTVGLDYSGPEAGLKNLLEVDLATGEERELPFWADRGLVQWDGENYYYVSMADRPVEHTGQAFGPGMAETRWEEYLPEGIRRGDAGGEGELVYALPDTGEYWINGLALGEGWLAWSESWEQPGSTNGYRLRAMELPEGEPFTVMESGHNGDYTPAQFRLHGGCLTYWNSAENPVAYDLAARQILDQGRQTGVSDAFYDGSHLVWTCPHWEEKDLPTFWLRKDGGETQEVGVPGEDGNEAIGGLGIFGGRYLIYSQLSDSKARKGVRMYDLTAGEVVYRSGDDPRLARGGYTYQSRLVPDDRGDTAVLISGRDGTDKMWITVFRMK